MVKKRRRFNKKQRQALHTLFMATITPEDIPPPIPATTADIAPEEADQAWYTYEWAALEKELEQIDIDEFLSEVHSTLNKSQKRSYDT